MADDQKNQKKSGFGGIFSGITRVIMKEEYLQQIHESSEEEADSNNNVQETKSSPSHSQTSGSLTSPQSGTEVDVMIKKIYAAFENMNQPGIDFLELWNAVEAMGGISEQNFVQAFKVLNIGAGNTLTVDGILASGQNYIEGLKHQIEDGINAKKIERQKLVDQLKTDKDSLTAETYKLSVQIQEMQKTLLEKQQKLAQLDASYSSPIAVIDQKINVGTIALGQVLGQLQSAIDTFSKARF